LLEGNRILNLKKFIDSIPAPLVEEHFNQKVGVGESPSLKSFDCDSLNKSLDTIQDENLKSSILEDFTYINDICKKMMNILVKAIQSFGIETDKISYSEAREVINRSAERMGIDKSILDHSIWKHMSSRGGTEPCKWKHTG